MMVVLGVTLVGVLWFLASSLSKSFSGDQDPLATNDFPAPLQGTITRVDQGTDGVQVELETEDGLYSITISVMQAEIVGQFEEIRAGAKIEVSGRLITGIEPPLIVAEQVKVLGGEE